MHPDRIPGAERASIGETKLEEFLLNLEHEVGGPRAQWLRRRGYTIENWGDLEAVILRELPRVPGRHRRNTRWGEEWEAIIALPALHDPSRSDPFVTGWEKRTSDSPPRFITGYPGDG